MSFNTDHLAMNLVYHIEQSPRTALACTQRTHCKQKLSRRSYVNNNLF